MANFGEEGPLRRRATREVAHPPGTILPRLTVTEHRDFEKLTFVPKPYRRTLIKGVVVESLLKYTRH